MLCTPRNCAPVTRETYSDRAWHGPCHYARVGNEMKGNVLAVIENNIATRLLLASRLTALGYHVTVASRPETFRTLLAAGSFEWLVLDGAVAAPLRDLLPAVLRGRRQVRIVWLGQPPRRSEMPIAAVFAIPLDYDAIAGYFAHPGPWRPRQEGGPARRRETPRHGPREAGGPTPSRRARKQADAGSSTVRVSAPERKAR